MCTTTNSSLMKKTKKELVDIILRKDAVHKDLNAEISRLEKNAETMNKEKDKSSATIDSLNAKVSKLIALKDEMDDKVENLKEAVEDYAVTEQKLNNYIMLWRSIAIVITILFCITICVIC